MLYLNDKPITVERFPNGESQIDGGVLAGDGTLDLRWHYDDDKDFLRLTLVKRHLDLQPRRVRLSVDYFPYSRMDRQTGDVFALKYVARVINDLGFDEVVVQEPHSDVLLALVDHVRAEYPSSTWLLERAMRNCGFDPGRDLLLFPDAGAQKRYHDLSELYLHLVGLKYRSTSTGGLSDSHVLGAEQIALDAQIIIVDDLCSYGGTFLRAAETVNAAVDRQVTTHLVVTHLEPAVYLGTLLSSGLFASVTATTSMQDVALDPLVRLYDVVTHAPIDNQEKTNQMKEES
jgi:ribose-phosphate pyrophosphokinase